MKKISFLFTFLVLSCFSAFSYSVNFDVYIRPQFEFFNDKLYQVSSTEIALGFTDNKITTGIAAGLILQKESKGDNALYFADIQNSKTIIIPSNSYIISLFTNYNFYNWDFNEHEIKLSAGLIGQYQTYYVDKFDNNTQFNLGLTFDPAWDFHFNNKITLSFNAAIQYFPFNNIEYSTKVTRELLDDNKDIIDIFDYSEKNIDIYFSKFSIFPKITLKIFF